MSAVMRRGKEQDREQVHASEWGEPYNLAFKVGLPTSMHPIPPMAKPRQPYGAEICNHASGIPLIS